jgi:carbonic anhydrase
MKIQKIIERLKEGNKRFVTDRPTRNLGNIENRKSIINRQEPFAIILSCADSRIVPEMMFDMGLGELFVIRVAGNIANTSSIASIEYAVAYLHTKLIVVLGHQNCGAVTAAVKGGDNGYNINHLLEHITPAIVTLSKKASIDEIAIKNTEITAKDLINRSTIIKNAVNSEKTEIVTAFYSLESGKVEFNY